MDKQIQDYKKIWSTKVCKIPKGFDIHHIDGNHNNNNIENLLMLPREIHSRYHNVCRYIEGQTITTNIASSIEGGFMSKIYLFELHQELITVLEECKKWFDYKNHVLFGFPNIHNIKL